MSRFSLYLVGLCTMAAMNGHAADKKILLIAGGRSHGPLAHEFRAGCLLWQKCLLGVPGIAVEVHTNGWPADDQAFAGAAAAVIYADGGDGHPAIKGERLKLLGGLMQQGAGFGTVHYGVEVPKDKGGPEFLAWQGGYFEMHWSVNPHWTANLAKFPEHPVTRGVKPFKANDEWYYHMRFVDGLKSVTPILTDLPSTNTISKTDGPHSGNPAVRAAVAKGEPQHLMWTCERADGGRGFGFTGGHNHLNWGNDNFRKVVLNAILWIAKVDVPENGVESTVTKDELMENLDPKEGSKPKPKPAADKPKSN